MQVWDRSESGHVPAGLRMRFPGEHASIPILLQISSSQSQGSPAPQIRVPSPEHSSHEIGSIFCFWSEKGPGALLVQELGYALDICQARIGSTNLKSHSSPKKYSKERLKYRKSLTSTFLLHRFFFNCLYHWTCIGRVCCMFLLGSQSMFHYDLLSQLWTHITHSISHFWKSE